MAKEISWDPTCAGMTIGIMEVIFSLHAMFQTPKINTDATTISSLADLSVARTEPPLTVALTEEELMAVVATPLKINLPCHIVAVERGVKQTTSSCLKSADPIQRDGMNFLISSARKKNSCKSIEKKTWIV